MPDKEPQLKQKILTDLSELESVERRWLASILAGITVGIINFTALTSSMGKIPLTLLIVLGATTVMLLIISLVAFIEYFSFDFHLKIRRAMIIKKKQTRPSKTELGNNERE